MFVFEILRRILVFAAAFAAAGLLTRPILKEAASPTPKSQSQETLKAAIGAGTIFEVLGGYASLAADFAWIKGYIDWTKKDISSFCGFICCKLFKLVVVPDVIGLVIAIGSQHKADRPGRKIIKYTPDARHDMKPAIRAVQRHFTLFPPVVNLYVETAAHGKYEFVAMTMGMPATLNPARHVVQIIHPVDIVGQLPAVLHHRQIAVLMMVLVKSYKPAIIYR